jgi:peptidoglycan/LPS O-acetylase OafA/YrhL
MQSAAPSQRTSAPSTHPHGDGFHIPSLDGVRALAFLMVFVGHAVPAQWSRVIPPGFGVQIFFVLSGYLITTLLRREFDGSNTINLKQFYLRRALRIWPPFYVVLAATTILTSLGFLSGAITPRGLLAYALHVANYWHIYHGLDDIPGGTSVYWSLAVEEHFYLVFPLLYLMLRKRGLSTKQQVSCLLGLYLLVLLWRVYLVAALDAPEPRITRATDTRVDAILAGCMLAIYGNPMLDKTRFSPNVWRFVWLPLGLAALLLTFVVQSHLFHAAIKATIQAIALLPFFVVVVRYPKWGPNQLLNTRIARFIGLLSYGLYLTHKAALNFIDQSYEMGWVPRMIIAFAAVMLICWGMYVFIEKPAARLRRQLTMAREPALQRAA